MTSRSRRLYTMSDSSSSSGGIGFTGALAILFIGLKLGGVISWSWLWVLSPLWIPLAVGAALLILFGIGAVIAAILSAIFDQ
jgi:hypothetical protein